MRTYTLEAYAPAIPMSGRYVRIHRGNWESNRDSFSPSMIDTKEVTAAGIIDARKTASLWTHTLNLKVKPGKPKFKLLKTLV